MKLDIKWCFSYCIFIKGNGAYLHVRPNFPATFAFKMWTWVIVPVLYRVHWSDPEPWPVLQISAWANLLPRAARCNFIIDGSWCLGIIIWVVLYFNIQSLVIIEKQGMCSVSFAKGICSEPQVRFYCDMYTVHNMIKF